MTRWPPGKLRQQAVMAAIRKERKQRRDEQDRRAAGVFPAGESGVPGPPPDERRTLEPERKRAEHSLKL